MIYTINNCIRAFGYTNFDKLIADMGSVDGLKEYVRANGYADIAVAEDTELLLVDVNGKTWHTGCYGAVIEPEVEPDYLCFTSTGDSTVAMQQNGTPNTSANKVIQYKINNGRWQTWDLSAVSLADGDKMYLKSDDEIPVSEAYNIYKKFVMTGSIAASGNIMSLLNFSTILANYAFTNLFENCTSLTTAPELPATTLANNCYNNMFKGCTTLTTAPELPATILAAYCYDSMFRGCTSLTTAPELPATTLMPDCYASMFRGCTSLTTTPALPATTLATYCYNQMFSGCTSLVTAPELPATILTDYCYFYMFNGCSNLNYVKALFTTDPTTGTYLTDWLTNVSPTGTFIKSKDATWTNEQAGIPTGWTVQVEGGVTPEPEPERDYLCFTSTGDSTVKMVQYGTPTDISANKVIQYKLNDGEWQTSDMSQEIFLDVTLADGDKIYLKSPDDITLSEDYNSEIYKRIYTTGSIAASGNIMSLLNFSDTLPVHAFMRLFVGCTTLTSAPKLPATTLSEDCYRQMFFNCSSLTTAPELPATTLAKACYFVMFRGCTNLNYVKAMFTTNLSEGNPVGNWLDGVSPTGTFIKSKDATWTNKQAGIPTGWTVQVEGGVTPEPEPERDYLCFTSTGDSTVAMTQKGTPSASANKVIQYKLNNGQWQTWDLSAITLADGDKMYLKSDDEIPVSEAISIYKKFVMTGSIAATGNIMSLLNFSTTLTDFVFKNLFSGCKSLTTAPELPATTLAPNCYTSMFQNCTKLNYVKAMFTTDPSTGVYNIKGWLNNVSATGTFIKSKDATWSNDEAGIPTGWTVQVEGGVTPEPEPGKDYLCFTSTGDSTVAMHQEGTPSTSANKVIQYKLNNGQWQTWDLSAISLADGDKMYVKSDDEIPLGEYLIYKKFVMTGSIAASGNIMSLLNFSDTLQAYTFYSLFYGCTSLTAAPQLPATTLAEGCYKEMFSGCTSLTTPPALPVTTLAENCYEYMFYGCASLTAAPELPVTTLTRECYYAMFQGCSKLNYVKAMFTDISAFSCLNYWLSDVSSTGTFVKNSAATWTNDEAGIPTGWTVQTASPDK